MHRYKTSTPRLALGITAFAMTALTITALVIVPAIVEADNHQPDILAAPKAATLASASAVAGSTANVVALREPESAAPMRVATIERQARKLIRTIAAAVVPRSRQTAGQVQR
ncbi:MAG: hypothetical protein ACREYD_14350 [Casimicrobiaceae bacterium]